MNSFPAQLSAATNLRVGKQVLILKATDPSGQDNETKALTMLHLTTRLIDDLATIIGRGKVQAYVNFLDTDLPGVCTSWEAAYYGASVSPLRCIKELRDPHIMFSNPLEYGLIPVIPLTQCQSMLKKMLLLKI